MRSMQKNVKYNLKYAENRDIQYSTIAKLEVWLGDISFFVAP